MSASNRIVKNTGILYAKMGITVFISLYSTRILLNVIGVQDFGIFNLVGGAIAMLTFLNAAMASATQRFMSYATGEGDHGKQRAIFNVSMVLHFIIAVLIVLLLEGVGYILFKEVFKIPHLRVASAKYIYQFMVVSTAFTIMSVPYDAVINAHENMALFAIIGVLESFLKLAIVIYLSYTSIDKLVVYGLLTALSSILLLLVKRIYCHMKYPECVIQLIQLFDLHIFKRLTSFAGWSLLGASSSMLTGYGQGIVMNSFFGPSVNTAQGIANQISGQLGAFAGTMLKALNPVIDKSEGAGDRLLMLKTATIGSKFSFFLLMIFFIPVLIEMPYVFKIWLHSIPPYAIVFCRLLLIKNLIEQLFVTLTGTIAAVGTIKKFQVCSSVINLLPLIVTTILFMLGSQPYVIYLVFIVFSIANGVIILNFAKSVCNLDIHDYMKNVIGKCCLCFLAVFMFSYLPILFFPENFFRLILVTSISIVTYILVIWRVGLVDIERFALLKLTNTFIAKLNTSSV